MRHYVSAYRTGYHQLVTRQMVLMVLPLASSMTLDQVADGVWRRYIGLDEFPPADLEGRIRSHLRNLRKAGLAQRNPDGSWIKRSEAT
jgi:hypothetical protein